MTSKRNVLLLSAVAVLFGSLAIYQNCTGTRDFSTSYSPTSAYANTNLQDLECAASGAITIDATTTTAINNVATIENNGGAFFYAEAPSAMGPISLVAPLDYSSLTNGGSTPSQIYGFFSVGGDGTAALAIGLSNGSSGTSPTPASSAQVLQQQQVLRKLVKTVTQFAKNSVRDVSQTCTSSNPLNLTGAIAAYNDGTQGLETANYNSGLFEVELNLDNTSVLLIQSYDVDDSGSNLLDTAQLQVYLEDSTTGDTSLLGDINLTQPD